MSHSLSPTYCWPLALLRRRHTLLLPSCAFVVQVELQQSQRLWIDTPWSVKCAPSGDEAEDMAFHASHYGV